MIGVLFPGISHGPCGGLRAKAGLLLCGVGNETAFQKEMVIGTLFSSCEQYRLVASRTARGYSQEKVANVSIKVSMAA